MTIRSVRRFAALCAVLYTIPAVASSATGFYSIGKTPAGAWRLADPQGRDAYLAGVDHVKWQGHGCARTGRNVFRETTKRKYGTKAAWEKATLARLKEWGFNLLGAGCDEDLRGRGMGHTIYLDIGGRMAHAGGMKAIRANPGDVPCGGFPNVFDSSWPETCARVAREMCTPHRNDSALVGYFIDNELAWWGDGRFDLECGLFDQVASLPAGHSARQALDAFLSGRGEALPDVSRETKLAFLRQAAERYFSVAAAAIRAADPNHLVMGCRFAGVNGAHAAVWEAAGRHCDVVTFNCYPWVDLDRNVALTEEERPDELLSSAIAQRAKWAQKPLLVTEWSFLALDSGLPCRHGAGQRFRTQKERTRAAAIAARTFLNSPAMVGDTFFMWVDEPYWGIRPELPEDGNYGLVDENDNPYPLTEMFARLRSNGDAARRAGLPLPRPARPAQSAGEVMKEYGFSPVAAGAFVRSGDDYTLTTRAGLVLAGRIGGRRIFDKVSLRGVEIGSWNSMLRFSDGQRPHWWDTAQVTSVSWDDVRGALTVEAVAGSGSRSFALTQEIVPDAATPRFLARFVSCANRGTEPLCVEALYFRQYAPYALETVSDEIVPHLWKAPKRAAWIERSGARRWGGFTSAADVDIFRYYTDAAAGSVHPDAGFRPGAPSRTLAPGAVYVPAANSAWMVAEADAALAAVDPFIGTSGTGHTTPAAMRPSGLVQPGPDTGYGDWGHCSGYRWEDMKILGFSQTHLSGTGCSDLGDFLLLPFTGALPSGEPAGVKDPSTEAAEPGYYSVALTNFGVRAEITAAKRVAFHRWTFPKNTPAQVLLDLQYGAVEGRKDALHTHVVSSRLDFGPDGRSLSGGNVLSAWLRRHAYFALRFDRPWQSYKILPKRDSREKADRVLFTFAPPPGGVLEARIAVSTADAAGARRNLAAEGGQTFDACRTGAAAEWNELLARADVPGADAKTRTVFKTSLYHLLAHPSDIADADGRYRGADGRIATATDGHYYTGLSLWDTFRAAHPLYTLLTPERVDGYVSSMIAQFRAVGYLPVIPYFGCETFCMIGNHAVPVVVDAYLKGFRGFDAREAFAAVTNSLTVTHPGKLKEDWELYNRLGYYPFDIIKGEGVSRTLECAYDDSCAARMAAALGEQEAERFFSARASNWRNVFDPSLMLVRGRDSKGAWRDPFDPRRIGGGGDWMPYDCTEGNAWQYTWHVLHAPADLAAAFGGKAEFARRLDMLFSDTRRAAGAEDCPDASGNYGQYAHGNEPSHHIAFLYNWAGRPDRTVGHVREIARRFYSTEKDGICGNDDCGQMGAWYVFAALGFYPVDPCGGDYTLGAPIVPRVDIRVPGRPALAVLCRDIKGNGPLRRTAAWNGKAISGFHVRHADIVKGGELVFEISPAGD